MLGSGPPLAFPLPVVVSSQPVASYKDSLMGESNGDPMQEDTLFNDDDDDDDRTIVLKLLGSQFNPISEDHGDAQDIEGGLDSIHAKDDVPPSNNQKHKGKQPAAMKQLRAVHVRKPLAVTLNDFSIVPRSAYIAVISGNSDPNLQPAGMNPSVTPGSSNSLTLGEPLDSSASLFVGSSEENLRNMYVCFLVNVVAQF
ncbi:hypothetical protein V6N12_013390 [Hibiscus sabdariffa]|uniref:Uncharacterized protein n=1 Tax=Hibiscus sabdariffa TaxID=183260 RepID=A0ABR2D821_9ROSI